MIDQHHGGSMRACVKALIVTFGLVLADSSQAESSKPPRIEPDPTIANSDKQVDPEFRLFRQKLAAAHALARAENHAGTAQAFIGVIANPMFGALPIADQWSSLSAAGWAAVKLGQLERARELYLRATAIDSAEPDGWYRLSLIESDLEHYDASAIALTRLAEQWPELLVNVDSSYIHQLLRKMDPASKARLDLLQSMFDANWNSKEGGASAVWYDLALLRIQDGNADAAKAAVKRVTSPMYLVRLRSDKRFDALVAADTWAFNVEHAAKREVEELQLQATLDPTKLDRQVQLSYAMLVAGMNDEVIALADAAVAAIADAATDAPPFTDIDSQIWLMNNRAIALRRLGQTDEALLELLRGSQLNEDGQINVSQALNLGQFYCSLGRPDDALAAIAKVGQMSGYGRMVQASVQLRAALHKKDQTGAAQALDYIREHRKDSQIQLLEALIEVERTEEAAQNVIELLSSPFDRPEVLEWMQGYRLAAVLPGDVRARGGRKALLAREDVQEAVNRVGRIQQYGIYGSGME